jgi:hypothetical protein
LISVCVPQVPRPRLFTASRAVRSIRRCNGSGIVHGTRLAISENGSIVGSREVMQTGWYSPSTTRPSTLR